MIIFGLIADNDTPGIRFNQKVVADVTPALPKKSVCKPVLDSGDVLSDLSIDSPKGLLHLLTVWLTISEHKIKLLTVLNCKFYKLNVAGMHKSKQ